MTDRVITFFEKHMQLMLLIGALIVTFAVTREKVAMIDNINVVNATQDIRLTAIETAMRDIPEIKADIKTLLRERR